jgi:hypothetical protein
MNKEIKPEFKNSIIYAFTGLGKTTAKKYNDSIADTDDILCHTFGCTSDKLHDTMSYYTKYYPDARKLKMNLADSYTDKYIDSGYTVLTGNEDIMKNATHAFLPNSIDYIKDRLNNLDRVNPYNKNLNALLTNFKRIETKLKNLNIPITYIPKEKYLSDMLYR